MVINFRDLLLGAWYFELDSWVNYAHRKWYLISREAGTIKMCDIGIVVISNSTYANIVRFFVLLNEVVSRQRWHSQNRVILSDCFIVCLLWFFFVFDARGWMALGCVPTRVNTTRESESSHQFIWQMYIHNDSVYPLIADIYSQSKFLSKIHVICFFWVQSWCVKHRTAWSNAWLTKSVLVLCLTDNLSRGAN